MNNQSLKAIKTDNAPSPVGPYNQAILAGEWLFCSGQIALDPTTGEMVGHSNIKDEANQVLNNLEAVLQASGAKNNNVVKTTIYLVDLKDFEIVNQLYAERFKEGESPARACIEVSALPKGARVEIDCVAWVG